VRTAKLIILAILILFLLGETLSAQINSKYAFTQSSFFWEPVWGTYLTDAMQDEGISPLIDIGFTFPYGDNNYTQVKISSNGWINLGGNLNLPYYGNDLSYLNLRPLLAPLWDDLSLQLGAVQYATFGLAPRRMFVVQWLAAKWNYNGNNEFNFMVRMHESGQIDFNYGPYIGTPNNASASIGINMLPGGPGYYYSILPGIPAQVSTTTSYLNISAPVAAETMYIFMPKTTLTQNAAAVNLVGSRNPMQNVASEYFVTVGNAGTNLITSGSVIAYLKKGNEMLASAAIPAIQPGGFATVALSWTPDTTGLMSIFSEVELTADADSLNNNTYPFTISVQPYVGNEDATLPVSLQSIRMNTFPNPCRENLTIQYGLTKSEQIRLEIFNLKGQMIKEIASGVKSKGTYLLNWDTTDINGKIIPNGIYFCRLSTDTTSVSSKLIILK